MLGKVSEDVEEVGQGDRWIGEDEGRGGDGDR